MILSLIASTFAAPGPLSIGAVASIGGVSHNFATLGSRTDDEDHVLSAVLSSSFASGVVYQLHTRSIYRASESYGSFLAAESVLIYDGYNGLGGRAGFGKGEWWYHRNRTDWTHWLVTLDWS
ncbi:MAG: hypothetical protein NUV56_04985, partial [Candidatus Uhrbacteria bacterium]|nr:hypothetical protein [Candidatus Uhrbacteria bacterium]